MNSFYVVLNATEEDIQLLLSAQCHIGSKNANTRMAPYIYKRRADGKFMRFFYFIHFLTLLT
jgi:small subunit ribosomal protein SAe